MNFLQRWLTSIRGVRDIPAIKFGRYDEVLKSPARFQAWDAAQSKFTSGKFLESVDHFFLYLYDPEEDNVQWERKKDKIEFSIHQGSQAIDGWANAYEIQAEVQLGKYDSQIPDLYENLLSLNYNLTYSKYCYRDGIVLSKFSSNSLDASPFKLYAGLRELALNTDKQDDLVMAQYDNFKPLFSNKVGQLSENHLAAKVRFFEKQWAELKESYLHCGLDPDEYPGAYSYLLMNFCYKMDYLLSPEAELLELLESIHQDYFHGANGISKEKNNEVFERIAAFSEADRSNWSEEFYEVTNTFGITSPLSVGRLKHFIEQEINKMDWYIQNGHREIALAIPGYIVGYSLFHYALPGPFSPFFQIYFEVLEADYFKKLGFKPALSYHGKPAKLETDRIIKEVIKKYKKIYPELKFPQDSIRYDSAFHFSKSYLAALCQIEW